jgi:hypothetical protein
LRSFDVWVERAGASTGTFDLPCSSTPLQSITAATSHRIPCAFPCRPVVCAGQNTGSTWGLLRIRSSERHPRVGLRRSGWASELASRGEPDRSAHHRSRFGSVHGLVPMSSRPKAGDGRASSVELRRSVGANRLATPAPDWGATRVATRHRSPSRGLVVPTWELSPRERDGNDQAPSHRADPKVALRGEPTEVGFLEQDTQREHDDTSHGVRFLSARKTTVIVAPACLTGTFRPQGFSPSRRFDPTGVAWLCFAPLPPIGFRPSELFPPNQPQRLSTPVALLPLDQLRSLGLPRTPSAPAFVALLLDRSRSCRTSSPEHPTDIRIGADISHVHPLVNQGATMTRGQLQP